MKKRIFTLMLSVFLVLGLVACGNKQEDEPAGNAESEPVVSTQTEENAEPEESTEPKEEESSEGTSAEQTGDPRYDICK